MYFAARLTHVYINEKVQWKCFESLVQNSAAFAIYRVGVYIIFSGRNSMALLASEASLTPVAKKNYSHFPCSLLDTYNAWNIWAPNLTHAICSPSNAHIHTSTWNKCREGVDSPATVQWQFQKNRLMHCDYTSVQNSDIRVWRLLPRYNERHPRTNSSPLI